MFKKNFFVLISFLSFESFSSTIQQVFTSYYIYNAWGDPESVSGSGSNLNQTSTIRKEIPKLLKSLGVTSLLDAPCGDFNWLQYTDLSFIKSYIGVDIVEDLIKKNNEKYGNSVRTFKVLNIVTDESPRVDLVMCRDIFVHLPFKDILTALKKLKASSSKYLLVSTFTQHTSNSDTHVGGWRPLNFELPPFNFPKPLATINEQCTEFNGIVSDKSLGLWSFDNILN